MESSIKGGINETTRTERLFIRCLGPATYESNPNENYTEFKKALNQKFETHYNDMSRINNALRQLEKLGKIKRNISMERVVSKKHPQGIEFPVVFSIEVKKD